MRYLCLCYYDQDRFEALSKDELAALARACQPHDEALRQSGHLLLVRIPTQAGHLFRADVGQRSDVIPASVPR